MSYKNIYWLIVLSLLGALALTACGSPATPPPVDPQNLPIEVSAGMVESLRQRPDVLLIDVREPEEYQAGHIPGAVLMPLRELPSHLDEIPKDKTVVAVCRSGNRSAKAADFLRQTGFDNIHNMQGGMLAWEQAGYEVQK